MSDLEAVTSAVRTAQVDGQIIRHGVARTIASWCHSGQASLSYSFVSTGDMGSDHYGNLWADLTNSGDLFRNAEGFDMDILLELYYYLDMRWAMGDTGPIDGWPNMWA